MAGSTPSPAHRGSPARSPGPPRRPRRTSSKRVTLSPRSPGTLPERRLEKLHQGNRATLGNDPRMIRPGPPSPLVRRARRGPRRSRLPPAGRPPRTRHHPRRRTPYRPRREGLHQQPRSWGSPATERGRAAEDVRSVVTLLTHRAPGLTQALRKTPTKAEPCMCGSTSPSPPTTESATGRTTTQTPLLRREHSGHQQPGRVLRLEGTVSCHKQ